MLSRTRAHRDDELDAKWAKAKKAGDLIKFGGGFYCGLVDGMYVFNGQHTPQSPPPDTYSLWGDKRPKQQLLHSPRATLTCPLAGFFMSMRSKYTGDAKIYYYVVEWSQMDTSWGEFRENVLGPTDPATAPADSLRGQIAAQWQSLGLKAECDVGDNGVHASASPFEAMAERANWLEVPIETDAFGYESAFLPIRPRRRGIMPDMRARTHLGAGLT
eukprot:COSAG01_NODE_63_length_29632_cov_270.650662_34_plen_216_part_00